MQAEYFQQIRAAFREYVEKGINPADINDGQAVSARGLPETWKDVSDLTQNQRALLAADVSADDPDWAQELKEILLGA